MTEQLHTKDEAYRGVLECPLRRGFISFEFHSGDLVSDLKHKTHEIWGAPRSGLKEELMEHGHLWDANAWAIFCETRDGSYVPLSDSERIPISPPPGSGEATESIIDRWSRRYGWQGLVHEHDMRDRGGLILVFDKHYKEAKEERIDVRLVALVAITGG